jgi:predicted RNA-binding Zn-ribbon protein involved in translation (DUF1610 family)
MTRFIGDETVKFEMPLADFSLYFVCPACGAEPQTRCTMTSGRRCAPHVGRLDIAKGYQVSMRCLAGLIVSDRIESGHKRTHTHRMKRRSDEGWRRAA